MAKGKQKDKTLRVPNRQAYTRISYLYQAANYLANISTSSPTSVSAPREAEKQAKIPNDSQQDVDSASSVNPGSTSGDAVPEEPQSIPSANTGATVKGLPVYLTSQLKSISLKSQAKLSRDMKRSICKRCNTLLVPGSTSTVTMDNKSRGGRKPWADVMVIQCQFCGFQKRYPTGSTRQPRKDARKDQKDQTPATNDVAEETEHHPT